MENDRIHLGEPFNPGPWALTLLFCEVRPPAPEGRCDGWDVMGLFFAFTSLAPSTLRSLG